MVGWYARTEPEGRSHETAPLPGKPAAGLAESRAPAPGGKKGARCSIYGGEKVYLGVRVRMPVRDLLKNIRLTQSGDPQRFQEIYSNKVKDKRVKTRAGRRCVKKKHLTKSLEELAIIVEVLEEDLRTSSNHRSAPHPPSSPELSPAGYTSDESDEMIPSPQSLTFSPGPAEYHQIPSPPGFMHSNPQLCSSGATRGDGVTDPQEPDWSLNNSAFFWTQLHKEESQLRDISDAELLITDAYGRTAFHEVACVGKRALGYAIAKRMAAINSLDLKDSDGMTALLFAAKNNHHLMVADLIRLGANVNETNNSGKSCLHLSAERGYIRVLEVLKHTMLSGVYVDVEAIDNSGMSVLQCASVALKATVRQLENSKSPNRTRLHTLRQEQMMETLECLLQMGSYLHTMGSWRTQPLMG